MDADTKMLLKMLAGSLVYGTASLFRGLVFGSLLPFTLFIVVVVLLWRLS